MSIITQPQKKAKMDAPSEMIVTSTMTFPEAVAPQQVKLEFLHEHH